MKSLIFFFFKPGPPAPDPIKFHPSPDQGSTNLATPAKALMDKFKFHRQIFT